MSTTAADAGHLVPPPRRLVVDRRLMGVAIATEIVAVALAYMAIYVPVLGPKLTPAEAGRYWIAALVSALVVTGFGICIARAALRARRFCGPSTEGARMRSDAPLPRIPHSLRFERVSAKWQRIAAAISLATLPVTIGLGDGRLWLIWLALLAPWAPLVVVEARFKFSVNAVFASFGLMVILQILHMVEHSTQVVQLAVTGGTLAQSHGVIGQLDFETVHFFADTAMWISLGLLAVIFRGRNAWLWVAFVAASLHEIEHLYLFWMYVFEHTLYLSGGAAGIMGHYGLIGSPLDRPYLHYTYNFIVFVPLLLAFWDQSRYVDRTRSQPST